MKINLISLGMCLILAACSSPKKDDQKTSVIPVVEKDVLHSLYNGRVDFKLPPKYERFNIQELKLVLKSKDKKSFFHQVFNQSAIEDLADQGENLYTFIDTSNYKEVIQFEKLKSRVDITSSLAQALGANLMESFKMSLNEPNGVVDMDEAKTGSPKNQSYKFAFYKMSMPMTTSQIHSNQFVLSSKTASYMLKTLSADDIYQGSLHHKLKFNE